MFCPRCGATNEDGSVLCRGCRVPLQTASPDLTSQPTGPVDGLRDVPVVFAPGQSLGDRYTVVERIGAGGMGLVYKAIDRRLGKTVALKLIQARAAQRPAAQERFRRELALAQQVTHPNVCRVHDLGDVDGTTFISMEYVEGQTLEVLIHSMGHLSPSQTVALGRQICAGLQAIHDRGIIHRDLKPGNVMVDRLGHVLLMDFGMAYQKDQDRLTAEGAIFGTLAYLSPEQGRGQADFRSDVYALGLILYEMLTGKRPPGDEGPLPLALRPPEDACPPPSHYSPEVPGTLDAIVRRCLERSPEQRYPSAAALGEALAGLGGPVTQTATMRLTSLPQVAPARRKWRGAAALALAATITAAVTWLTATRWNRPPEPSSDARSTLALLPLLYEGPDDSAFLKDLVPLALARDLARAPVIDVAPFATSRSLGAHADPRTAASHLAVSHLVRGVLRVQAGHGVGRLDLVRADGSTQWSREFEGDLARIVEGTKELSAQIAAALGRRVAPATARGPAALQAYLEGLARLEGWEVKENYLLAREAFRRAIAAEPEFADAHAGLALALLNEYNQTREAMLVEQAADAAKTSLRLSPTLPEGHVASGLVLLWRGRSAEAGAAFEQAARLAPADDAIFRRIGVAYSRNGRREDADAMFERAIKLRPGFWDNYNAAGSHFLQTSRPRRAIEMYKLVIELNPESDIGYGNLGAALILTGAFKEAVPLLAAAIKLKPTSALHTNLGMAYFSQNRFDMAVEEYKKALAIDVTRPEIYINLGDALRQLGRQSDAKSAYATAIRMLREQLKVIQHEPELRAKLAIALAGSGRCEEAGRELRGVGSGVRGDLAYYVALSHALCQRHELAVKYSLEALGNDLGSDIAHNPDFSRVRSDQRVRRKLESLTSRE